MKATQIFQNGKVRAVITYTDSEGGGYIPEDGALIVEGEPSTLTDYWDGVKWVTPTESPSKHHIFDYDVREWVDLRSLEEAKYWRKSDITAERNVFEFGGFTFQNNVYDSDQVSQGRIMGAAVAGVDQVWTLADNSTIELTALQLTQLYQALQLHIAYAHERGRIARQLIHDAETVEGVESIVF